jgi:hypothetical protein
VERLAFVRLASQLTSSRRGFVKQGIEIAMLANSLGDLVKTAMIFDDRAIHRIWLDGRADFSVYPGDLAGKYRHVPAIGQMENYLSTVATDNRFTFMDGIAGMKTTHFASTFACVGFSGIGRDGGNNLCAGHDNAPEMIGNAEIISMANRYAYCTTVQFSNLKSTKKGAEAPFLCIREKIA